MEAIGFGVMHVDEQDRVHLTSSKSRTTRRRCRASRTWRSPAWASTCSRREFLFDQLRARCRRPELQPRFRQGHHPATSSRTARRWRTASPAPASGSNAEAEAYWRDVGTVDAYWEANIDLTAPLPALDLYDRDWPIWTDADDHAAGEIRARRGRPARHGAIELADRPAAASSRAPTCSARCCSPACASIPTARIENAVILPDAKIGARRALGERRDRPRRAHPRRPRGRRGPGARRRGVSAAPTRASASSPSR